jgi:hypothetical protein
MRNAADVTGGKPFVVFLQSISGVGAINPLAAFYDLHRGRREVLFFYFLPGHHTRLSIPISTYIHKKICKNTPILNPKYVHLWHERYYLRHFLDMPTIYLQGIKGKSKPTIAKLKSTSHIWRIHRKNGNCAIVYLVPICWKGCLCPNSYS